VTPRAARWLRFNLVGAIGIPVQFGAFAAYFHWFGWNDKVAAGLAVETAVLHNFVWHQLYTWKHLPRAGTGEVAGRLLRFHLGNGIISIAGNVLLMQVLADMMGLNHYLASGIGIAVCSLLNFAASEWFVFRP
jgi:putative flippase GtrA